MKFIYNILKTITKRLHPEHGQTLVFSILFLGVLLGFSAVVIDGGRFLLVKRNLQGVADAAALAGIHEMPDSTALAESVASSYTLTENPEDGASVQDINTTSNDTLDVTVEREQDGAFLNFFGIEVPTIVAHAQARVSQVESMGKMLPFALMEGMFPSCTATPCDPIGIKTNGSSSNRGSTSPDLANGEECDPANGADDFRDTIKTEENGGVDACALNPGETLPTKTGNNSGPTEQGFDDRIGPGGSDGDTFEDIFEWDDSVDKWIIIKPDSPRIGVIPIVLYNNTTDWPEGAKDLTIVGYQFVYIGKIGAAGEPAYDGHGANHNVWFTPLEVVLPDDYSINGFADAINTDLDAPIAYRLTQ